VGKRSAKIKWVDLRTKNGFYKLRKTNPVLFKQISIAIEDIRDNAFCATQLPKRLIPDKWKEFSNLWKYDLPAAWRLFYSIAPPETPGDITIIAVILDWMSHKEYERLFKY